MSSIIEGYNYDIFISYRQKDNKGDRWVSEFVEALKTELESTFKEEISAYFDINPHDGLLETHDVDASLKDKLKCLVFIPIISRTYCDPKSFAWEHEFRAFVEQASADRFGLKVKLPNGNVASRVLPVRIHDLDVADIKECESVLGGVLRGVEFIYKSPGVNRPLRSIEDKPFDNLTKTIYRDQINKVANAIKEIIVSLKSERDLPNQEKPQYVQPVAEVKRERIIEKFQKPFKLTKGKLLLGSVILVVIVALLMTYPLITARDRFKNTSEEILKKAIAFCDFMQEWDDYYGKLSLKTVWENGNSSDEIIEIQTKENFYKSSYTSADLKFTRGIKNGKCFQEINGNKNPAAEMINAYGLDCKSIQYYKEHHYCHFGLLMELKTSGLVLNNNVETVKFNGIKCLALTFKCDTTKVKSDYFSQVNELVVYIDPANYSMKGTKTSGRYNFYIVFSGILNVNGIKIPLCKTYFNSDDNSLKWIDLFTIAK
jgi:hypothetical protein